MPVCISNAHKARAAKLEIEAIALRRVAKAAPVANEVMGVAE
jgi:hypothetical protein